MNGTEWKVQNWHNLVKSIVFYKGVNMIQWIKSFHPVLLKQLDTHMRKKNLGPYLNPHIKSNLM